MPRPVASHSRKRAVLQVSTGPDGRGQMRVRCDVAELKRRIDESEARRLTADALRLLRDFWNFNSPSGHQFTEFLQCTFSPYLSMTGDDTERFSELFSSLTRRSGVRQSPSSGGLDFSDFRTPYIRISSAADDGLRFVAEFLCGENSRVRSFAIDVRDWDAHRITLLRRVSVGVSPRQFEELGMLRNVPPPHPNPSPHTPNPTPVSGWGWDGFGQHNAGAAVERSGSGLGAAGSSNSESSRLTTESADGNRISLEAAIGKVASHLEAVAVALRSVILQSGTSADSEARRRAMDEVERLEKSLVFGRHLRMARTPGLEILRDGSSGSDDSESTRRGILKQRSRDSTLKKTVRWSNDTLSKAERSRLEGTGTSDKSPSLSDEVISDVDYFDVSEVDADAQQKFVTNILNSPSIVNVFRRNSKRRARGGSSLFSSAGPSSLPNVDEVKTRISHEDDSPSSSNNVKEVSMEEDEVDSSSESHRESPELGDVEQVTYYRDKQHFNEENMTMSFPPAADEDVHSDSTWEDDEVEWEDGYGPAQASQSGSSSSDRRSQIREDIIRIRASQQTGDSERAAEQPQMISVNVQTLQTTPIHDPTDAVMPTDLQFLRAGPSTLPPPLSPSAQQVRPLATIPEEEERGTEHDNRVTTALFVHRMDLNEPTSDHAGSVESTDTTVVSRGSSFDSTALADLRMSAEEVLRYSAKRARNPTVPFSGALGYLQSFPTLKDRETPEERPESALSERSTDSGKGYEFEGGKGVVGGGGVESDRSEESSFDDEEAGTAVGMIGTAGGVSANVSLRNSFPSPGAVPGGIVFGTSRPRGQKSDVETSDRSRNRSPLATALQFFKGKR
ncbi:hypothetical protein BJ742DRAFT_778866 [Cladochytrium replicatum]|nr:hypothetical protein BJ742DRAFT_778866 [Cladochytrium replicatum]